MFVEDDFGWMDLEPLALLEVSDIAAMLGPLSQEVDASTQRVLHRIRI